MDSQGFNNLIGSFVLLVLLSQCCHHIVHSQISPTFKGLECSCGENCTYGVQDCHLFRCACPYEPEKYNSNVTCIDDLCPDNCCELIPRELRNRTATHFMFHEKYESNNEFNNESEGVQTFQIFTKLNGSANARWIRTLSQQHPHLNYIYLAESLSARSITDKLATGMTAILDNEAEAPDKVFGVSLDSIDVSEGFSVPLQCHDGFNTSCDSEFCSCIKFSTSNSIPEVTLLKEITGGNIVFDIGNDKATVSTSSSLTPYHSIDVTKRPTDSLGGWAPFFNDSSPWVEFSDIQEDVCGVVVQGVDWATSRRLDKFEVKVGGNFVQSLEGQSYFLSGMVLGSKNFHLFSTPVIKPSSLRMNVLQPNNRLNVGFRASLITCGDATEVLKEFCNENSLAESTKMKAKEVLKKASQGSTQDSGKDQVSLVGNIYDSLKTFLDENFEDYKFPEGRRFTVNEGNAEIDVYFVKLEEVKKTGYSFNNSETKNISDDNSGFASVYIPADGFSTDDVAKEIAIVASVVGEDVTEEADKKTRSDEYGYQYSIVSPVVTVSIFVKGVEHEAIKLIEKIEVKVPHKNTKNPRPFYFEEADVSKSRGEKIQWSAQKCSSTCHEFYCEINCTHATSFAVLQLLGQSKLSELGRLISSIMTTIGCLVSIISLMMALVIYFVLRSSIASAQYAIHSNLMISLLIALCIFTLLLVKEKSKAMCDVIKFLLQYFFSAAFCWMLCEGIHLYRQIITVFETGSKHIWVYFLIGWAVPLLFVVISIAGSTIQPIDIPLRTNSTCFFSYRDGSIWYFVAPVLVVMLINTGILVRVILIVVKAAKIQAERKSSEKAYQAKAGLRSALLLFPLLGCSYIIGFFVSFSGALELTYNIVNSLQGFFIALFYCALNKEIRAAIVKCIERSRDQNTIQASTTGSTLPKSWSGTMSKHITSSRNQVAPEPVKKVYLEDI